MEKPDGRKGFVENRHFNLNIIRVGNQDLTGLIAMIKDNTTFNLSKVRMLTGNMGVRGLKTSWIRNNTLDHHILHIFLAATVSMAHKTLENKHHIIQFFDIIIKEFNQISSIYFILWV